MGPGTWTLSAAQEERWAGMILLDVRRQGAGSEGGGKGIAEDEKEESSVD